MVISTVTYIQLQLCTVSSISAKRLAGKNVSKMTQFVSNGDVKP